MRLLVTGGAGFIGTHLVAALLADGHRVRVLDDMSSGRAERLPSGADLVEGDVTDPAAVREAMAGCEVVCHLAAKRSVLRSVHDPLLTDRTNTYGTLVVLDAAVATGVRRVVNASSSSVYGGAAALPTGEDAPLVPRSPYAVSKMAAEHHCRVMAELHGLETLSLRYFNVFGPGQPVDGPYATVIPLVLRAAAEGAPFVVHGDGHQSRDFCFVGDAVRATVAALTSTGRGWSGEAINVAGGQPVSVLEMVETVERISGRSVEIVHEAARPGDVRHTHAELARAGTMLGWRPQVGFEEGLAATAAASGEIRPSPPGGRTPAAASP